MANGNVSLGGQGLSLTPANQQRIRLARAMQQQGMQGQNRTPLETIGNTLMNIQGQRRQESVLEDQEQRRQAYADTMRRVSRAGQQGTVTGPGGGGTGEVATSRQRMIDALSSNPDTAPTAAQLQLSQALQPEQARTQTISGEQANRMFGTQLSPGAAVTVESGQQGRRITDVQEPSGQDSTQTEREIRRYMDRGYSRSVSEDIAFGNIDVETDQFGNTYLVNKATGNRRVLRGEGGGQGRGREQPARGEGQPGETPGTDLEEATEEGTGPFSMGRAAVNAVVGPFIEGTPFPETSRSRAAIRNFNQTAKQALVNSDRFPVYEQKIVQQLLPDPDQFFNDPDAEREKLTEMRGFLQRKKDRIQESMQSGGVTTGERGELSNQVATIDRILGLMEPTSGQSPQGGPGIREPEEGSRFTVDNPAQPTTREEYEQLPSGAYFRDDEGLKRKP